MVLYEIVQKIKELEQTYNIADEETEEIIYHELEAEKARLRLYLKEARKGETDGTYRLEFTRNRNST